MTPASETKPKDGADVLHHLHRITLQNLLSFGPDETASAANLELRPLNVLIGPNGSKPRESNLIAAIGLHCGQRQKI